MTPAAMDSTLLDVVLSWRDQPAHPDLRGLPTVNVPALSRVSKAVPPQASRRVLATAYATSLRLSRRETLLRELKADSLEALRARPIEQRDALAKRMARQSGWLAGGSGAVLGLAGAAGMVADVPALLLIALRTLIRMGYCYGEEPTPALTAALFALASADTESEKSLAWQAALTSPSNGTEQPQAGISEAAVRDGLERAAEREFAKQALAGSLQKLTATLVQRLGVQKAAGVLPVVGAVVGGAVNLRFVYLLSQAARMAFLARALHAGGVPMQTLLARGVLLIEPPSAVASPRRKAIRKPAKKAPAKVKRTTPRRPSRGRAP